MRKSAALRPAITHRLGGAMGTRQRAGTLARNLALPSQGRFRISPQRNWPIVSTRSSGFLSKLNRSSEIRSSAGGFSNRPKITGEHWPNRTSFFPLPSTNSLDFQPSKRSQPVCIRCFLIGWPTQSCFHCLLTKPFLQPSIFILRRSTRPV